MLESIFVSSTFWTALSAFAVAAVTGFFAWLAGHRRTGTEAQTAMLAGYTTLLKLFEIERTDLKLRVDRLEAEKDWMEHRIYQLESIMRANGLTVPPDLQNGNGSFIGPKR